jgi:hypothetical protein
VASVDLRSEVVRFVVVMATRGRTIPRSRAVPAGGSGSSAGLTPGHPLAGDTDDADRPGGGLATATCERTYHRPATLANLRARSCGEARLTGGARVAMHSKRTAVLIASLAVALAACGGDDDVEPIAEPTPTETAAPTEEPTPEEPDETEDPEPDDPFAIPDEIDEPYVQSVLDELFALRTQALKAAVEANGQPSLSEDAARFVGASHEGPLRLTLVEQLQDVQAADNVDAVFLNPSDMGQERFALDRLMRAESGCIVAVGFIDSSEVSGGEPNTETYSAISLSPADSQPAGLNPTPWLLYDEMAILFEGEPAKSELVASLNLDDLGPLLDTTCEESA